MMNPISRPLAGCVVGLSISESDDSARRGFPPWQVNRVTLQVVSALFGQGVGVMFGHDWREDGVMEAVHGFALQMQPPVPLSPQEAAAADQPLLQNLLPWPDEPSLPIQDRERLASTLRIEKAGLPADLRQYETQAIELGQNAPLYRYLRARGLTHLRHCLDSQSDARLCIGGRTGGSAGRFPGVIEEALLAVESRKPLFLVGILGGATRQVIGAIGRERIPENFCQPTNVSAYFEKPPVVERDPGTARDRVADRRAVWSEFAELGLGGLSEINRLTTEENQELFNSPVLDRVIQLVLTGLSRLRSINPA